MQSTKKHVDKNRHIHKITCPSKHELIYLYKHEAIILIKKRLWRNRPLPHSSDWPALILQINYLRTLPWICAPYLFKHGDLPSMGHATWILLRVNLLRRFKHHHCFYFQFHQYWYTICFGVSLSGKGFGL